MLEREIARTFIQTTEFTKQWKNLGFDDEDLRQLELLILQRPDIGPVMEGTGGLRKMRFAYEGRGKSGSVRVCYVDFICLEIVYLITAFPKNEKDNLSKAERNEIKKRLNILLGELKKEAFTNE